MEGNFDFSISGKITDFHVSASCWGSTNRLKLYVIPTEMRGRFWVRSVEMTGKTCEKGSKITFFRGNGVVRISTLREKLLLISPVRLSPYTVLLYYFYVLHLHPITSGGMSDLIEFTSASDHKRGNVWPHWIYICIRSQAGECLTKFIWCKK